MKYEKEFLDLLMEHGVWTDNGLEVDMFKPCSIHTEFDNEKWFVIDVCLHTNWNQDNEYLGFRVADTKDGEEILDMEMVDFDEFNEEKRGRLLEIFKTAIAANEYITDEQGCDLEEVGWLIKKVNREQDKELIKKIN